MRKIMALLLTFAALFSLAACSVDSGKTTAELVSEAEAEQSMLVESSIQAEVERSEEMVESIDKIGKTEKNKQLVIKRPYAHGERYQVYVMNKKGICKEVIDYYFYNTSEMFERNNEKQKSETSKKKIDSDPATRMVVFKTDYDVGEDVTFEMLYDRFAQGITDGSDIVIIE